MLVINSFKRTGFFLRISLSHILFQVGCFSSRNGCSHPFSKGFMEQIIFGSSYFLKTTTFLDDISQTFDFFMGSVFISPF